LHLPAKDSYFHHEEQKMKVKPPVGAVSKGGGGILVNYGRLVGFLFLTLAGVMAIVWTRKVAIKAVAIVNKIDVSSPLERMNIEGIDVLLQRPTNNPPKGILFLGHGCSHSHTDFWPPTPPTCSDCLGLPEEMAIVDMARNEYQFVVVAISSQDRGSKCWSGMDGERVAKVLASMHDQLQQEFVGVKIPLLAFGASSGGSFVGNVLPKAMTATEVKKLDGFIAQIAAPNPSRRGAADEQQQQQLPVAVYITMNRDEMTDKRAKEVVSSLTQQNRPATQIRLDPLPITASFFHDRIPSISLRQSAEIVKALEDANFLEPETKLLKEEPRMSDWRSVIRPCVSESEDSFVADASPISEVLNVAQGVHEMTRDGVREAIEYILLKMEG